MTTINVHFATAVPVVPVDDFDTAMAFYSKTLRFEPLFEQGAYGGARRGDVELHLDGVTGAGVGTVSVRITVVGVDALYAELMPTGAVDPNEPLETKPWGTRQFSARDCCGNRLTFVEAS